MKFTLLTLTALTSVSAYSTCSDEQSKLTPNLCSLLDRATNDAEKLADELFASPISAIQKEFDVDAVKERKLTGVGSPLPVVVAHGMGE